MKKLINNPEQLVVQMCKGIELTNPEIEFIETYKIIKKRQIDPQKVSLISGGGSGHEPAHAGYIGNGMLDAAICGDVFASPSQIQVYQGIKAAAGEQGTLLIIKNYSGDMMNFKNAAAMAEEEGFTVDYVKVEDDIAVNDSLYTVGRRGVAGTVLVHKTAGAAAMCGKDLAEVKRIAQKAADRIRTIGVGYSSCTVPAAGQPTFQIGADEMEYGVGIHGEPGRSREPVLSADLLAQRMCNQLVEELQLVKGAEIALLINGFGGTPLQELYVMTYSVVRVLDELGIKAVRIFTGNYMTSIEMQGCSVSVMKLDDELKQHLDMPSSAPAFPVNTPVVNRGYSPLAGERAMSAGQFTCQEEWRHLSEQSISLENLAAMVACMGRCIIENETYFCELDAHAGDGDFGMSIAKGFTRVRDEWAEIMKDQCTSVQEFLLSCSVIIMEHCGGASGPIWGSAFRAAALTAGRKTSLSSAEFAAMMEAAAAGIQKTGKESFGRGAEVGDKTLIDALVPCAEALRAGAQNNQPVKNMLQDGAKAALSGAERTREIVARMGRAGAVGERSLGFPDAGAYALGVIFTEIANFMKD